MLKSVIVSLYGKTMFTFGKNAKTVPVEIKYLFKLLCNYAFHQQRMRVPVAILIALKNILAGFGGSCL